MSALVDQKRSYSEEEYFEIELASESRHELRPYGRIVEMTGGTTNHSRIAGNTNAAFRARIDPERCEVFGSDLRVKSRASTLYFYPDVTVVCGEPDIARWGRTESVINPLVIVEVLSPTTEVFDRGGKLYEYIKIESLRAYVLIEQHKPRVDAFQRSESGEWQLTFVEGIDATLSIECLRASVPLTEIYRRVTFVPQWTDPNEQGG